MHALRAAQRSRMGADERLQLPVALHIPTRTPPALVSSACAQCYCSVQTSGRTHLPHSHCPRTSRTPPARSATAAARTSGWRSARSSRRSATSWGSGQRTGARSDPRWVRGTVHQNTIFHTSMEHLWVQGILWVQGLNFCFLPLQPPRLLALRLPCAPWLPHELTMPTLRAWSSREPHYLMITHTNHVKRMGKGAQAGKRGEMV